MFDKIIGPDKSAISLIHLWPVIASAFISSLAATWMCKKIALKLGIVDKPDDLVKTHKEPIAYLGGVAILVGLTVGILAGIVFMKNYQSFSLQLKWLLATLAGAAIACFVGLADDVIELKPSKKILGQLLAALALIFAGIKPELKFLNMILPFTMPQNIETTLEFLTVVIFVLGATNSLNLLDGLDGLCAGVTAIITVAMLILSIHLATWQSSVVGDPVRIVICLALVGGTCGFLPFNKYPAKIFMGDAGSMLLGFTVAALMIQFAEKTPRWLMASVVLFGLPILDTAVALIRRLINHRPLFVSDRGHIYDQMIDRGIPLKKTVLINYLLAAGYAAVALFMSQLRIRYALPVYIIVFAVSAFVVWKKGFLKMQGIRGAIPPKSTGQS